MRWFTSDLHLGHTRVVDWRPFADLTEMHAAIRERWNAAVNPDDEVYLIGDAVMGRRVDNLPLLDDLAGRKYLIPGNHDHCHPGVWPERTRGAKVAEWSPVYGEHFEAVLPLEYQYPRLIAGRPVLLCHFPVSGDHTAEERYPEWRPGLPEGTWLLHGHIHGRNRVSGHRQIDVGVDAWGFAPASEDAIAALIAETEGA